jgi:hypothetical protein
LEENSFRSFVGTKKVDILPNGVITADFTASNTTTVASSLRVGVDELLRPALLLIGFTSTVFQPAMP